MIGLLFVASAALAQGVGGCLSQEAGACAQLLEQRHQAVAYWSRACELGSAEGCLMAAYAHGGAYPWVDPFQAGAVQRKGCALGDEAACVQPAHVLTVTPKKLLYNGEVVVKLKKGVLPAEALEGASIAPLLAVLQGGAGASVRIESDPAVPSGVIQRVSRTAQQAGFGRVEYALLKQAGVVSYTLPAP